VRILEEARERLRSLCLQRQLDRSRRVVVSVLSPDDAIGKEANGKFPIKRGRERVIEAAFDGARGQAFTDHPSAWSGTLTDGLSLDLSKTRLRAVFTAAMNAVLCKLQVAKGTVHCRDQDPVRCGSEIAASLEDRFGKARVGLIGLQPAILAGIVSRFGAEAVLAVDLNPEQIGTVKHGVRIRDGGTDLARLVEQCDVGLATGSSIVNGTMDEILERFSKADKPVVFFGNTVSGAAALMDLDRSCPFGR